MLRVLQGWVFGPMSQPIMWTADALHVCDAVKKWIVMPRLLRGSRSEEGVQPSGLPLLTRGRSRRAREETETNARNRSRPREPAGERGTRRDIKEYPV